MSQIIFLNTAISGRVQTGLKQFTSVKGQKTPKARNNPVYSRIISGQILLLES